ncbi:MAG: MBL fold metallo-hydrolase [Saprospiraceae bacterium]|nr:MBL fold metallo-hydrolase [Saprospiraceae bacterium]
MKITILGSGTSQGVPVIGCNCNTCISDNPKDHRLRSSVLIESKGRNILIDIGPDFRQQMLTNKVNHIDSILLTHEHNDHVIGLDDIRPFNFKQNLDMPVYALDRVLNDLSNKFGYIFNDSPYPGIPRIVRHPLSFNVDFVLFDDIIITPIKIMHGTLPILGFRVGNFAYITDASLIEEQEMSLLDGLDVLVLNALQYRHHYSHFTFREALDVANKINSKATYLTHLSHDLGRHDDLLKIMPDHIFPSYDSLVIHIN